MSTLWHSKPCSCYDRHSKPSLLRKGCIIISAPKFAFSLSHTHTSRSTLPPSPTFIALSLSHALEWSQEMRRPPGHDVQRLTKKMSGSMTAASHYYRNKLINQKCQLTSIFKKRRKITDERSVVHVVLMFVKYWLKCWFKPEVICLLMLKGK